MSFDPFGLRDRVVLITGATRGNGLAIAQRMSEAGAEVVVTSRHAKEASTVAKDLGKRFRIEALGRACDVSKRAEVERLFRAIDDWTSRPLAAVVNNAGYPVDEDWWDTPLHEMTPETVVKATRDVAAVDLEGSRWCTYYALPRMMKARRGSLVYTSSTPAIAGYKGFPYTEAKSAVLGLMRDVARAYGPYGIRSNAIAPGNIRTDWLDKISPQDREKLEKENPLQRFGEPREVADAVLFLASDLSSFVTGETLIVDGGTVIR